MNFDQSKVAPLEFEMQIRLTTDTPFFCPPRRFSFAEKQEVDKIVKDLLAKQIIKHSDSPYASPIVLTKKKSGETRMCVDYRALNKYTVRDNYPLPLIEDCLEYLGGKKIFSVLDLKSCFHQVKVSSSSTHLTSFVTPNGQHEFVRMPFGLKNAPSVFQRFVSRIFRGFTESKRIVVYMDDIVIASDNLADHLQLLGDLLQCLSRNGLELKLSKCRFVYPAIE